MSLLAIAERRKMMQEMQEMKRRTPISTMMIPYELAMTWVNTEKEYQISLANHEAAKMRLIIKELTKEIEELKRKLNNETN